MATKTKAEWAKELNAADILNAPVNDYRNLFAEPQIEAIGAVRWVEHDTVGRVPMGAIAGVPAMATENPCSHSPDIGQYSREILAALGLSASEIAALVEDGTVATVEMPRAAE